MQARIGGESSRAQALKTQIVDHTPSISSERARIITESFRRTSGRSAILRRAAALSDILTQKALYILDGELIVGNQSVRPRAADIFPEFSTRWILEELDGFPNRDSDIFVIDDKTKQELRDILPEWNGLTTQDAAVEELSEESYTCHRELVYILTSLSSGVGHIAVGYERAVTRGLRSIIDEAKELREAISQNDGESVARREFYDAVEIVCEAAIQFAHRFGELATALAAETSDSGRRRELEQIARVCSRVPEYPAESFHEALQSFWFVHVILQIESNGHSMSPGRMDQYLYPYYRSDIEGGRLTRGGAKELLENVWLKFNEINKLRDKHGSKAFGGYPLFQNVIVGGVDANGKDAANELSFLCMEVTRELKLPQPSFSVRWHSATGRDFMREAVEIVKAGIGMPAFFNDEVISPMLLGLGYSLEEARNYAEVGCVEPQAAGTTEGYYPSGFLNLSKVLEIAINNGINPLTDSRLGPETGQDFDTFDDFYAAFRCQLQHFIDLHADAVNAIDQVHARLAPTPFASCFVDDCVARGVDVRRGGARYNFSSPNAVALANAADALLVLKRAVFDEGIVGYAQLREILRQDFEGHEPLRQRLLKHYPKFGNDEDEVDAIAAEIARLVGDGYASRENPRGGRFYFGLQSISAHALFVNSIGATPDGRKKATLLADGGCSPAQGRDRKGPTAVAKSVAKIDHYRVPNGTLLNIKLHPLLVSDEPGTEALIHFVETYFGLKGQHVQFNVVSADVLRDAQVQPEQYRSLVVRVAGFSVYFTAIDSILQEDIVRRTEQMTF